MDYRILAHKDAKPSVVTECLGQPLFSFVPGARVKKDPVSDRLSGFLRYGAAFAKDCSAIDAQIKRDDVVVVTFSTEQEVYGVSKWLRTIPETQRPRVIFNFLIPDFRWEINEDRESMSGDISFHRYAANEMAALSSRFLILASNEKLGRALSGAFNRRCEVAPVALIYFSAEHVPGRADDPDWDEAHIGVIGEFRREKGGSLVAEVIKRFRCERPGRRVFLQVNSSGQADVLRETIGDLTDVIIHVGQLSQRSYIRRLETLDILLLPYMPKRYAIRTSGIFSEAVGYGVVAVVPDNTWMSDQLVAKRGSGVVYSDTSAEGITKALVAASDRYPDFKKKAAARCAAWRTDQSTTALWNKIDNWLRANP